MVCISVWLRMGLSRYTVEQLGASKPVSHIAQTNTRRSGSSVSLNRSSSGGWESFMRWRCGAMSRPSACICAISFCAGDTITAMSVPVSSASRAFSSALCTSRRACSGVSSPPGGR